MSTASSTAAGQPLKSIDAVGEIERRGTERIPEDERSGKPSELVWVWFSAAFGFAVIVLGSLPVSFGLGWWSSVSATMVGLVIGTALFVGVARLGLRTATNDATSSGAHFGVRGRGLGALITIFVGMGFYALAIWTGGETLVHAGHRLFGLSTSNGMLAVAMALVSIGTVLAAIYGHATLVATYKWITVVIGVLLLVLVITLLGHFDAGFRGGHYLLGSFTRTWVLAVSVAASLPISYATFAGDYTRYMPAITTDRAVIYWNALGMFASCAVALLIGIFLTTEIPVTGDFVTGVANRLPSWALVPMLVVGLLGSVPQGALCLYNAGLAANGMAPRQLPRVATTLFFSAVGLTTVFLAVFAFNAISSITAFVLVMLVTITPWLAILLVGFAMRRGSYDWRQLLQRDGVYWYTAGFNPRAFVAFVPAAVVGFLFSSTSIYTGPLVSKVNGLDLSYTSAFVIAAVIYGVLCVVFPERAVVRDDVGPLAVGNTRASSMPIGKEAGI
jgi:purine-cytosine permease-like protein